MKNIFLQLIIKDFKLEWKQRSAFFGLLLYCAVTIFISYLAFRQAIDGITWNALFWIIMLFASVNALAKSFLAENHERQLYFYTLSAAPVYFLAKLFYGVILMLILSIVSLMMYSAFNGFPAQDLSGYVLSVIIGNVGLAVTLTMISAIASRSGSQTSLMAILGFPVLIPMLILIIKLSTKAIDGFSILSYSRELTLLFALIILTGALSYILFPYIWRE